MTGLDGQGVGRLYRAPDTHKDFLTHGDSGKHTDTKRETGAQAGKDMHSE